MPEDTKWKLLGLNPPLTGQWVSDLPTAPTFLRIPFVYSKINMLLSRKKILHITI